MSSGKIDQSIEYSEEGFSIEIYTDERIREFLAENKMTPELKLRLEEKLTRSRKLKSHRKIDRS